MFKGLFFRDQIYYEDLRNAKGKQTKNHSQSRDCHQTTRTQQARLSKISRGKSLSGQKDGFSTKKHNPAFGLPLNVDACNDRNHIINVFDSNII
jgi:hypothetical protein